MLLSSIRLKDILSFKDTTLELGPLNVLIGPNAAGKSNLIEVISLLQAAPGDLGAVVLRGGGIGAWAWNGGPYPSPPATLECVLTPELTGSASLYKLTLTEDNRGFLIMWESFEDAGDEAQQREANVHFDRQHEFVALGCTLDRARGQQDKMAAVSRSDSVLARFKTLDPTPITRLGQQFERIKIYHEFSTSRMAQARIGIATSMPKEFLQDGGHNLAMVLHRMDYDQSLPRVNECLARLCEGFERVGVSIDAGIARVYVRERGLLDPVLAIRLSDGTLKFLCLLAILLHPQPPPLVCIEEPEIGLHPDALQLVAQALVEASARCQMIVTTHSADLVDSLSDHPEAVVVCERDFDYSTQFKRLKREDLDVWLEDYRLGELWRKGEIGGNRW